jgi:hypothetical protein
MDSLIINHQGKAWIERQKEAEAHSTMDVGSILIVPFMDERT